MSKSHQVPKVEAFFQGQFRKGWRQERFLQLFHPSLLLLKLDLQFLGEFTGLSGDRLKCTHGAPAAAELTALN